MSPSEQEKIISLFTKTGGTLLSPVQDLFDKLSMAKAVIFDWDGVFNNGENHGEGSLFSEIDSMGTNMLRFLLWLQNKYIPYSAIITGSDNKTAVSFAKREHFNDIYLNAKNKGEVLDQIILKNKINENDIIFFFDDILDLAVAERSGISIMIGGSARPLWNQLIIDQKKADYITAHPGGQYGLREGIELLLGISGRFDDLVEKRSTYKGAFEVYFNLRNDIETQENLL